jgi:hypothetical protein
MIRISEKSSGGALVDWVPEGHHRQIHRTRSDVDPEAPTLRIFRSEAAAQWRSATNAA